jgi:hypothetical protein
LAFSVPFVDSQKKVTINQIIGKLHVIKI